MELKHYTLSQIIAAYARPSNKVMLVVKHDGCGVAETEIKEGMTVSQAGHGLTYMIPLSQEEIVTQRLYKMRFKDVTNLYQAKDDKIQKRAPLVEFVFEATIGGRSVRQTVARVRVFQHVGELQPNLTEEPCVGVELGSPKEPEHRSSAPCVGLHLGAAPIEPERVTPEELAEVIQDPAVKVIEVGQPREAANDPVKPAPTLKESLLTWWRKILS